MAEAVTGLVLQFSCRKCHRVRELKIPRTERDRHLAPPGGWTEVVTEATLFKEDRIAHRGYRDHYYLCEECAPTEQEHLEQEQCLRS